MKVENEANIKVMKDFKLAHPLLVCSDGTYSQAENKDLFYKELERNA